MLKIENLHYSYLDDRSGATIPVLSGLDLELGESSILALLGPSGCGKTTTLLAVAGMLTPSTGQISLDGRTLFSSTSKVQLPPAERSIGFMFQSYAIWPHMTAIENVLFALKMSKRKLKGVAAKQAANEMLKRFGLEQYANQPGTKLSGGQQQRLALARALISEPSLLLLDEPLSSVEPNLRSVVAEEIRSIHDETGVSMVLVTHDHQDAMALSSTIAVMSAGKILQKDAPETLYQYPANAFVANFFGRSNILAIEVAPDSFNGNAGLCVYQTPLGQMWLKECDKPNSSTLSVSIKHTSMKIHQVAPSSEVLNVFPAQIVKTIYFGHSKEIFLICQGVKITARGSVSSDLAVGDSVFLEFSPHKMQVHVD